MEFGVDMPVEGYSPKNKYDYTPKEVGLCMWAFEKGTLQRVCEQWKNQWSVHGSQANNHQSLRTYSTKLSFLPSSPSPPPLTLSYNAGLERPEQLME